MKTTLYLGTDPTHYESQGHGNGHLIHYPVIKIVPRPFDDPEIKQAYAQLEQYTHLIFTSKNAVKVFKTSEDLKNKIIIAIGKVTAAHLSMRGLPPQHVAVDERQEGVVELLKRLDLGDAYFFLPRSSLSRPVIVQFFKEKQIRFHACDLYDTVAQDLEPKPDLDSIDEIVFTSPSTVEAFLKIFGVLPKDKKLITIGPITSEAVKNRL